MLKTLASSIDIHSHSFHLGFENWDNNNKSDKSEVKQKIKLKDKINQNKLICQTDRANS